MRTAEHPIELDQMEAKPIERLTMAEIRETLENLEVGDYQKWAFPGGEECRNASKLIHSTTAKAEYHDQHRLSIAQTDMADYTLTVRKGSIFANVTTIKRTHNHGRSK